MPPANQSTGPFNCHSRHRGRVSTRRRNGNSNFAVLVSLKFSCSQSFSDHSHNTALTQSSQSILIKESTLNSERQTAYTFRHRQTAYTFRAFEAGSVIFTVFFPWLIHPFRFLIDYHDNNIV